MKHWHTDIYSEDGTWVGHSRGYSSLPWTNSVARTVKPHFEDHGLEVRVTECNEPNCTIEEI